MLTHVFPPHAVERAQHTGLVTEDVGHLPAFHQPGLPESRRPGWWLHHGRQSLGGISSPGTQLNVGQDLAQGEDDGERLRGAVADTAVDELSQRRQVPVSSCLDPHLPQRRSSGGLRAQRIGSLDGLLQGVAQLPDELCDRVLRELLGTGGTATATLGLLALASSALRAHPPMLSHARWRPKRYGWRFRHTRTDGGSVQDACSSAPPGGSGWGRRAAVARAGVQDT